MWSWYPLLQANNHVFYFDTTWLRIKNSLCCILHLASCIIHLSFYLHVLSKLPYFTLFSRIIFSILSYLQSIWQIFEPELNICSRLAASKNGGLSLRYLPCVYIVIAFFFVMKISVMIMSTFLSPIFCELFDLCLSWQSSIMYLLQNLYYYIGVGRRLYNMFDEGD
jgi:hypothetical protein